MDENINRLVHQALGLEDCYHAINWDAPRIPEERRTSGRFVCRHCSQPVSFPDFHRQIDFCNDLNAAFRFAEKLADKFEIQIRSSDDFGWMVTIDGIHEHGMASPAKAICLAGLAAIGEKV